MPSLDMAYIARLCVLLVAFLLISRFLKTGNTKKNNFERPQRLSYNLPFGLDFAWMLVKRFSDHTFLDHTKYTLLNRPGRTVEINLLGNPIVLTDRLENIKAIQQDQFSDFAKGQIPHDTFSSILGDSVFTTDGELWKSSRKQLDPHVSRLRHDDAPVTEGHIQNLFSRIRDRKDERNGVTDVYDVIDRLQLDIVTEVFLGESAYSLKAEEHPFRDAMERLLQVNTIRLPFGRLAKIVPDWLIAPKSYIVLSRYIDGLIAKTLAHPMNQGEEWKDLNLVEDIVAQHPGDRKFIRGQLVAVLMAAKDPASILLSWVLYHLSQRPDLIKQLQDEIRTHIGIDVIPEPKDLTKLTLLEKVLKETQRMYHPLGLNVREARVDTTLPVGGGPHGSLPVSIPKGQLLLYSVDGLQKNESIVGANATEWDPSRWDTWDPKEGEYIPFSLGPRSCPGKIFGLFQMRFTLVRMLQEYESISWAGYGNGDKEEDAQPMPIMLELNCKPAKRVLCQFVPRVK